MSEDFDGPSVEPTPNITAADGTIRPVRPDEVPLLAQAWDANVQAVQDAKQAVRDALVHASQAEARVDVSARRRSPRLPIPTDNEVAQVRQTYIAVEAAKRALADMQRRFKDGVTADQLARARRGELTRSVPETVTVAPPDEPGD